MSSDGEPSVFFLPPPPWTNYVGIDDYRTKHSDKLPIIIDNGSFECRAGQQNIKNEPSLIFRNEIRRPRKTDKIPYGSHIGWNITEEVWKLPAKHPFDHGLLYNQDNMEDVFDFIFYNLGYAGKTKINNSIAISEPLCNPNYCRNLCTELLFELYNVNGKINYSIGSAASYYFNSSKKIELSKKYAMIIEVGEASSTVLVQIDGALDFKTCKRIDIGGSHMSNLLHTHVKLKYPDHKLLFSPSSWATEYVKENHIYTATSYSKELADYFSHSPYQPSPLVRTIQLPIPSKATLQKIQSKDEQQRKRQEKINNGNRLKLLAEKRRAEKLEQQKDHVEKMNSIIAKKKDGGSKPDYELAINEMGFDTAEDFLAEHKKLTGIINKAKKPPAEKKGKKEEVLDEDEIKRLEDFDGWVKEKVEMRKFLIAQIEKREFDKNTRNDRRSAASQNRMQLLNQAADTRADDSEFDDWDVYNKMQVNNFKEEMDKDKKELQKLTDLLTKHAPDALLSDIPIEYFYQIKLSTERIQIPEILFQPTIIGEDQMGLSEAIECVFREYTPDIQQELANNIFVTGGCSKIPQFIERLENDIRQIRPAGSSFRITRAADPRLDTWRGLSLWGSTSSFKSSSITKDLYSENGVGYIKPHELSNLYHPTPSIV